MRLTVVKVPGALLLDRNVSQSAKLLWIVQQVATDHGQRQARSGLLQSLSGLSRHTVLDGAASLAAAGWSPTGPARRQSYACASVPHALVLNTGLSIQARLLYGSLQLIPGFGQLKGHFTYAGLSDVTGVSTNTLTRAVGELAEAGWMQVSRKNKLSPLHFVLCDPVAEQRQDELAHAARRLEESNFKGEAIMREYLTLLVDNDEFEDNATPGFLVNPFTDQEMQYDRYYPAARVALEFNGAQHNGPTLRYSNQAKIQKLQARDYIKAGISQARGITLVVIRPDDLTLVGIQQKVQGLLPLRDLSTYKPLIAYLESVSLGYRRKTPPSVLKSE